MTRYASTTGHHVSRRFGWDCHGLPVEYEIDKKLSAWRGCVCVCVWWLSWKFVFFVVVFIVKGTLMVCVACPPCRYQNATGCPCIGNRYLQ